MADAARNREKDAQARSDPAEAMKCVLVEAPYDKEAQDANRAAVINTLNNIKEGDIDKAVSALDADQIDVLMKYIYAGLAEVSKSTNDKQSTKDCASLLKWHQVVTEKGGLGPIVRVFTDKPVYQVNA